MSCDERETMPHKDPEARRAYKYEYHLKNQVRILARVKAYQAQHKIERAVYMANYAATHRQKLRDYRQSHPEQFAQYRRTKHARKLHAPVNDLTHAQWLEIQLVQDHRCAYCGKRAKNKLTQDHITPLSKGGSHTLHNIIGACSSCNSKKRTGPPLTTVQPLLLTCL